jgi:hypothetical protein
MRTAIRSITVGCLSLALGGCSSDTPPGKPGTGGTGGVVTGTGGSSGSPGSGGAGGASGAGGSAGSPGAGGAGPGGTVVPLPMTVTSHYTNQGWFGDPSIQASFMPNSMVIKQVDSSIGPCANRDPMARGKCLQVVYTPPAGLTPPTVGAFVGVFFLTTLSTSGEANWGTEPAKNVAPGAKQISFYAAAAGDGLTVTFKAGTDKDSFVVPESTQTLTTGWKKYSLSLGNMTYGTNVIGAFAWVLLDTKKAATFYLDGIVWE